MKTRCLDSWKGKELITSSSHSNAPRSPLPDEGSEGSAAFQLQTHLFLAFQTGRREKLIPIPRRQQRPQQPPQSSAHPSREGRDLENKTRGARSQAAGRTSMDGSGGPRGSSITMADSIYLPAGGQISAFCCRLWSMKCPTWDACCPQASQPPSPCPCPARHHLGQGPSLGTFSKREQPISCPPILPRTVPWWDQRTGIAADHPTMGSSCQQHTGHNLTRGRPDLGRWRQRDGMKPPRDLQGRVERRKSDGR